VLPAAPSPVPRLTFSAEVRHGAGPAGEDAADEDEELDDEGVAVDDDEEPIAPSPAVESELEPQPPSSRVAASSATASEGFFTPPSIEQKERNTCVRRPVLGR
jgi:hypothetical protein